MKKYLLTLLVAFCIWNFTSAQTSSPLKSPVQVKGYVSVLHPLVTFDKNGVSYNFKDNYVVGIPVGINLFKTDTSLVGFTFEITPFLKYEKGSDKVANFLFHPGVLFRVKKGRPGFTAILRGAFETSGRYGVTPILHQTLPVKSSKPLPAKFFIATPLPVRFGAGKPVSFNVSLILGVVF